MHRMKEGNRGREFAARASGWMGRAQRAATAAHGHACDQEARRSRGEVLELGIKAH